MKDSLALNGSPLKHHLVSKGYQKHFADDRQRLTIVNARTGDVIERLRPTKRNAPLSAARRLVDRLPDATLVVWDDGGHLTGYRKEAEILARC